MKFGPVELDKASGAVLAHALDTVKGRMKKGTLLTDADIEVLRASAIKSIIVARPGPDDVAENTAAELIGDKLVTVEISADAAFTGRVNLHANVPGVLMMNEQLINEVNRIDAGITLATLPQFASVEAGRLVATVKIIPFAVDRNRVEKVVSILGQSTALELKPYRAKRVGLIATELSSLKTTTMDKTRRVLEARLAPSKSRIVDEIRVPHKTNDVADAIDQLKSKCDLIIIFGASAIIDAHDVVPSALEMAGGKVDQFGMPVDPGNLLLLGHLGSLPVIGVPGCARSPRENTRKHQTGHCRRNGI